MLLALVRGSVLIRLNSDLVYVWCALARLKLSTDCEGCCKQIRSGLRLTEPITVTPLSSHRQPASRVVEYRAQSGVENSWASHEIPPKGQPCGSFSRPFQTKERCIIQATWGGSQFIDAPRSLPISTNTELNQQKFPFERFCLNRS